MICLQVFMLGAQVGTELIRQEGFAVWVAVALLTSLLAAFGFLGRWFFTQQLSNVTKLRKSIDLLTVAVLQMKRELLAHDLTVRGLNPEAGVDFEDRDSKALPLYNQCIEHIGDFEARLRQME